MSTETPERPKSAYQLRGEAIARALGVWQDSPDDGENPHTTGSDPLAGAAALEDCLREEGLQILPAGPSGGRWRVLAGGKPVPYAGQSRPSGPVDADTAAELFLLAARDADQGDGGTPIVVRPATDREQVQHAVLGDAAVIEDAVEIDATTYWVIAPTDGAPTRTLEFAAADGKTVRVRLRHGLFEALANSCRTEADEIGGGE
ncbi:hypothetical protein Sme01_03990 [Sphaerisporangium melleum]|uniref:Uncharacterized protein n=1 Tax=Sphaerisporangium melleum TaxID=321316 RepID=A0A917VC83_9ACTN|nr:hypothetical protein [Sphaerisporangium melleum]GGK62066.1 hypothetical protein GCM10007964_01540 [Sphaerisporangium melleum]GII67923.1 hypothetical protein Sme01_03990 [Sphaerisporangium melleum]